MEKGEGIKGERRGRKGDGRRESRIQGERRGRKGDERRESTIPCPPFKLAPIWLDTLLINTYNEPIYFINMNWH